VPNASEKETLVEGVAANGSAIALVELLVLLLALVAFLISVNM